MTETRAIAKIRYRIDTASQLVGNGADGKEFEDLEMAIQALEEIQEFRKQGITIEKALDMMCDLAGAENLIEQYRAIGTVEECEKSMDFELAKQDKMLAEVIDDYLKYIKIGTIEEFKALKESAATNLQTIDVSELLGEPGNDGWIACSERLPEEDVLEDGYVAPSKAVLVLTKYNSYKVSRYWGNRRNKRDYHDWVDIEYRKNEVIAWKPIAPYQPKGE